MPQNYPQKVTDLALAVKDAGGRAMLVGGCVRDELMGIPPKDWDVEVYGVEPEKLKQLLEEFVQISADTPASMSDASTRTSADDSESSIDADRSVRAPIVVGEAFAVYKIGRDLDVSLPRRERKVGRGHRGFVVTGDPGMSFEEACSRRDFTINAILKDPLTGEIIDPFNGRDDINAKVLRHVSGDTFAEDSLRVLRAAQFAARFEFEVSPETAELCSSIDVTDLPRERIWGELEKLLLQADAAFDRAPAAL
jgi:tRNA nucleotidyltransferase (CCA-adding enzyme)